MAHDDHDPGSAHRHEHRPVARPGEERRDESGRAPEEHKAHAPAQVACYVITSSDSRTADTDSSGAFLREALERAGHTVVGHALVKDEPAEIAGAIAAAERAGVRAVIITGGTGLGRRDVAVELVASLIEKRLDGFGELFRMLSYQEIGSAAMMSRALAGTHRGMILFALPGSTAAVKLAMEKLILPELGHAVREMTR